MLLYHEDMEFRKLCFLEPRRDLGAHVQPACCSRSPDMTNKAAGIFFIVWRNRGILKAASTVRMDGRSTPRSVVRHIVSSSVWLVPRHLKAYHITATAMDFGISSRFLELHRHRYKSQHIHCYAVSFRLAIFSRSIVLQECRFWIGTALSRSLKYSEGFNTPS